MPKYEFKVVHKYAGTIKTIVSEHSDFYTALREHNLDYTIWIYLGQRYVID